MSGATVTQIRDDIYLIDVVTRAEAEQRVSLATLRTLQVALSNRRTVPLTQFASVDYGLVPPRVAQGPVAHVTVQAEVALEACRRRSCRRSRQDQRAECEPAERLSGGRGRHG